MKCFGTKELGNLLKQTAVGFLLFIVTSGVNLLTKPSINSVSEKVLCESVVEVGKTKSKHIVLERQTNGKYKSMKDFQQRNKGVVGEIVFDRISNTYTVNL